MEKFDLIESYVGGKLPPHPTEYPMEPAIMESLNSLFEDDRVKQGVIDAFIKYNNSIDTAQFELINDLAKALKKPLV